MEDFAGWEECDVNRRLVGRDRRADKADRQAGGSDEARARVFVE